MYICCWWCDWPLQRERSLSESFSDSLPPPNPKKSRKPVLFQMEQSSADDLTFLSLAFEDALRTQLPKRSDSFKSIGVGSESEQSKRREKLLERQKQSRRDLRNHARSIAHDEQPSRGTEFKRKRELEDDSLLPGEPSTKAYAISYDLSRELAEENKKRIEERVRQKYSNILMLPEEMLEVPDDIQENWFAVPLPVGGKRCAVYSAKGRTTSRLRNGAILHRFNSNLPGKPNIPPNFFIET